jgi:hypothetical protein
VELLQYRAPANGRANPPDARPEDLWHVETRLVSTDLGATLDHLGSVGIGATADDERGVFVRDPDGHALRVHRGDERRPSPTGDSIVQGRTAEAPPLVGRRWTVAGEPRPRRGSVQPYR